MEDEELKDDEKETVVKEEKAKKAKKGKKKKSKKKRRCSSSNNDDLVVGETDVSQRKKKKTKTNRDFDKEAQESDVEESLEGALVDGEMVLIDRKSGKVYSGLDRRENGERKEIGKVSKSGSIVLKKAEKGKNKQKHT
mmetsp:Transcript_22641/g.55958  ORF Transcript_22641/g.55958 Transcript_22641/m.55958 type:complete len:138 (-) Transcript_22641:917-1330(-)